MGGITEAVQLDFYLGSPSDWVWHDDVVTYCGIFSYHQHLTVFLFNFAHKPF